jgi:hypothetical protein
MEQMLGNAETLLVRETHPTFWMMPKRNKCLTIDAKIQKQAHISLPW